MVVLESPKHQDNHGDLNEAFGSGRQNLVVFAETTGVAEPGEGSLDQPTPRQDFEGVGVVAGNDGQCPGKHLLGPLDQSTGISAVGKNEQALTHHIPQAQQQEAGAGPVLNAGREHDHRPPSYRRQYGACALSPSFLRHIRAAPFLCRLDRLRIDNGHRRLGLLTRLPAHRVA